MPIDKKNAEIIDNFAEKGEGIPDLPKKKKKRKELPPLRWYIDGKGTVRHGRHPRTAGRYKKQWREKMGKKKGARPVGRPRKYPVTETDLVPFAPPSLTGSDAAKAVQFRRAVHSAISNEDLQEVVCALRIAAVKGDTVAARLLLQYTVGRPEAPESRQGPTDEVKVVVLGTRAMTVGGTAGKEAENVEDES